MPNSLVVIYFVLVQLPGGVRSMGAAAVLFCDELPSLSSSALSGALGRQEFCTEILTVVMIFLPLRRLLCLPQCQHPRPPHH